ncbi:protein of unknown function DUF523 [Methanosalsum zhilinae DSM 4017]|uniref:DUF1722 domain-containing protein n=1 Tax=Methanosalsum zhilinae (strain DSM 4017 / NBRC 107636 / OCM 62 / WeN5) TaxID=679901 RepID=F7XNR1_METZD|nr:DUF523 and DUF1722 domain-containing protein [Methanosalsum zhilinae]AEH61262.1 protein of unknown function DUF523 [Methanosalsum zhilinae DSM 4017]
MNDSCAPGTDQFLSGDHAVPKIVISRCIEFDNCRYDGRTVESSWVRKLAKDAEFIPVCPECSIGLGVPRQPVLLVSDEDQIQFIQPHGSGDLSEVINRFSLSFLNSCDEVDGFILKSKSPSCGINDVKLYIPESMDVEFSRNGTGIFSQHVIRMFPYHPMINEINMENPEHRDYFLSRVFTLASFRNAIDAMHSSNTVFPLIRFHRQNEIFLKSFDRNMFRQLDSTVKQMVGDSCNHKLPILIKKYHVCFLEILSSGFVHSSRDMVILDISAIIQEHLCKTERIQLCSFIINYFEGNVDLLSMRAHLRSIALKYNISYLLEQTFFNPYPMSL